MFESLGRWHNYWSIPIIYAPDKFTDHNSVLLTDQQAALRESYEKLLTGFDFARRKLKDEVATRIVRELIEMAYEAFRQGDGKLGSHILQEAEGMIWVGSAQRVKYAVEAERRAFGEVTRYKDIRISPYPYEGTRSDLGAAQAELLATAEEGCLSHFRDRREFKYLCWIKREDGVVEQLKAASRKKLMQRLHDLSAAREIIGAVVCEFTSPTHGSIVFKLHERGKPEIDAIAQTKHWTFDDLRFHLDDPTIFTE